MRLFTASTLFSSELPALPVVFSGFMILPNTK
jgi:hypothetical protein